MNILIVRVSSLGDVVHNMPMVADIRRHFPEAKIDWVVEESYTSLVRMNPQVHEIIPIALRRWRKSLFKAQTRAEIAAFYHHLRHQAYDVIFDTQGLLKTSIVMRMARLAPRGRRVGLANATEGSGYEPLSRVFHTQSVAVPLHTHAVTRARLVAATALGYKLDNDVDFGLRMPVIDGSTDWLPHRPYAIFFHGTARAAKLWVVDNWLEIGMELSRRGLVVALPWGNSTEKHAAHQLAAKIPYAQVLPALSLSQATMLICQAELVIGLDTGLTHIAAAWGRPTIELYCDSPRWKTQGDWSPRIVNLGDTGAAPSVAQVVSAIDHVYGAGHPPLSPIAD